MTTLAEVLRLVIVKVKAHRSLYERNEMAVRNQLVEPVLRVLGWEPENPDKVVPDLRSESEAGVPDYTLKERTVM